MPNEPKSRSRHKDLAGVPLYGLFLLTGVGTALLGATLPVTLVQWRLTDASAGWLFLLMFVASSAGSLASRAASAQRAGGAGLLLAVCCGALAFVRSWAVFPLAAAYGFGIGFSISTVTRVRLLCPAEERVREVNRLNLGWGLGAFLCPTIANELLRHSGVPGLFFALASVFVACGIGTLLYRRPGRNDGEADASAAGVKLDDDAALPWMAAAAAFLAVGLESSLGAWLATYAHRLAKSFAAPVEAITLFWLGLLASRALCSTRVVHRVTERQLLLGLLVLTAAGCVALVASQHGELVLGSSLLVGFGVGPVFPMLLAAVLPRVRGNLIFVIAGVGASVLPWMTGELSGRAGSLRVGVAASALAGMVLLAMGPRLADQLEELARQSRRTEDDEPE